MLNIIETHLEWINSWMNAVHRSYPNFRSLLGQRKDLSNPVFCFQQRKKSQASWKSICKAWYVRLWLYASPPPQKKNSSSQIISEHCGSIQISWRIAVPDRPINLFTSCDSLSSVSCRLSKELTVHQCHCRTTMFNTSMGGGGEKVLLPSRYNHILAYFLSCSLWSSF